MKLSNKILNFHVFINNAVPYLVLPANALRLRITAQQISDLQAFLVSWNAAYPVYATPATHTTASVDEKVKQQLKHDTAVTLTGTDLSTLDIHQDAARRAAIPVPTIAPSISLRMVIHSLMSFFAFDPAHPHDRKKPVDVAKVGIKIAVVKATDPAPTADMYLHHDPTGTTSFDLFFTADQAGMIAYVICFYMNSEGEPGPDSLPLANIII